MEENTATAQSPMSKLVLLLGVVILLVGGFIGVKVLVSSKNYKVLLIDAPKEVTVGKVSTFTWNVDGPPATISHTAAHFGLVSNPGELGKDVKPADTKYTEMVADFASGQFNIPLRFVGNTTIANPGTYYFRIHAVIDGKNYWTDEYTFSAKELSYSVSLSNAPTSTTSDVVTNFTWFVDGPPTVINHTAVHFGSVSSPGVLGENVVPEDTEYTNSVKDFITGEYNIPLQFVGNVTIATPGTYFYRAHAVVGGKNYWTDEYSLEVK